MAAIYWSRQSWLQCNKSADVFGLHDLPPGELVDWKGRICRTSFPTASQASSIDAGSGADTLWYFAFGSNMDPDVLGKVRHVYPHQSEPCKVSGFVLTFAHRGLPYEEPGFGTIEPLERNPVPPTLTITSHAQQNGAAQPGKATMYSTPSTAVADQLSSKQHADADADQDPQSPRPGLPINGVYGSPELPVSFGPARSAAKRSRTSPVSDSSCDYESNDFDLDGSHAQGSHASSGMGLHNGHRHVEVHGVVHQISQMDMAQICKTESGGGGGNHGYYLESLSCQLYKGQTVQALALLTFTSSLHHQVSRMY